MGAQYNKVLKRKRRQRHNKRKLAATKLARQTKAASQPAPA